MFSLGSEYINDDIDAFWCTDMDEFPRGSYKKNVLTLHKVSKELVENYDLISIEDLNVKGVIKNRKLSKHIADVSWGTFVNRKRISKNR